MLKLKYLLTNIGQSMQRDIFLPGFVYTPHKATELDLFIDGRKNIPLYRHPTWLIRI